MMFLNEYDIDCAAAQAERDELPNLAHAVDILTRLVNWTNRNSDGWAYWPKPCRAAKSLQELIYNVDRFDPVDLTPEQVKKASSPIKAFLTRQGVQDTHPFFI